MTTSSRERVYEFVAAFASEHGYAPTWREIAGGLGTSLATVHWHLGTLKAEGRLAWEPGKQRTLRVVA